MEDVSNVCCVEACSRDILNKKRKLCEKHYKLTAKRLKNYMGSFLILELIHERA